MTRAGHILQYLVLCKQATEQVTKQAFFEKFVRRNVNERIEEATVVNLSLWKMNVEIGRGKCDPFICSKNCHVLALRALNL